MRAFLTAILLAAACGNPAPATTATPPAAATTSSSQPPAPPPADAEPPLDDCANACTEIAGCWEEENPGREYNQGGNCVSACEGGTPEEKKGFFQCVEKGRGDCAKMVECG